MATTTPQLGQEPLDKQKATDEDLTCWSVTTLIGCLDKPALIYWAAEQTALAAVADLDQVRSLAERDPDDAVEWLKSARFRKPRGQRSATELGTAVHKACETYALTGQRPDVDAEVGPFLDQFDRWAQRFQPTYQATEVCVYHPRYGYAGTCDAFLTVDGVPLIADYKTSRKSVDKKGKPTSPYPEVALQLAAYRYAELAAVWRPRRTEKFRRRYYLLSPDEQAAAVPVPEVEGGVCIHITPEHCEAYPVRCDEAVFERFLFVVEAARWAFEMSKEVIADAPLEAPEGAPEPTSPDPFAGLPGNEPEEGGGLMPIVDFQRRLHERGRIRIGVKDGDRGFPKKIDTFRFTSADQQAIADVAHLWGGQVEPWDSPNGAQHQVVTEAKSIPVLVPPGAMAFSQWYELWSGGGCQRRCDGRTEQIGEQACLCDPEDRQCKPTTRLSVVLPDLPGVGLWRIESHGYYAAVELGGGVELLQSLAPGALVPGRLWLDARSVKRADNEGKVVTQRFIVPVLDIDGTMKALGEGAGAGPAGAVGALSAPVQPGLPNGGLTPVPTAELAAGPQPSIADQVGAVVEPAERPKRANAQAALPATGLRPGPAESSGGGGEPAAAGGATPTSPGAPPPSEGVDLEDLQALMEQTGVSRRDVLHTAKRIAHEDGHDVPAQFRSLKPGALLDKVYRWVEAHQPPPDGGGSEASPAAPPVGEAGGPAAGDDVPQPSSSGPATREQTQQALIIRIKDAWPGSEKGQADRRHALAAHVSGGRTRSTSDLSKDQLLEAHRVLERILDPAGGLRFSATSGSGSFEVVEAQGAAA